MLRQLIIRSTPNTARRISFSWKKSNNDIIKGYAEAKDINVSLDKTEKTDQMKRYAGYQNLFLTDYLEFRFFKNGEKYENISLGKYNSDKTLSLTPENGRRLMNELEAFLEQTPESIKSGKRLSEIMGAKARRIRDNVAIYLEDESIDAQEMRKNLRNDEKVAGSRPRSSQICRHVCSDVGLRIVCGALRRQVA